VVSLLARVFGELVMRYRVLMASAASILVLVAANVACDPLTLPVPPDGGAAAAPTSTSTPGASDGGVEAAPITTPVGIVPAGALLGETKSQFGGDCQTWAMVDGAGKITELNFSLPVLTVDNIPPTTTSDIIWFVELPQVVKEQTIFKSLDYTYLPAGHAPAGVYDTPHMEWHLSTYTFAQREAIDCQELKNPTQDNLPQGKWIFFPTCLPKTGQHAYDLAAPEYNGERFVKGTKLFYYKGLFNGIEPSVARQLLLQRAAITFNDSPTIKVMGTKGLYPRKFTSRYDGGFATYVFTYTDWTNVE
jgi:hypothetical protein